MNGMGRLIYVVDHPHDEGIMSDVSGRQMLVDAISLSGADLWPPSNDVPGLNRPRTRPESLPGKGGIAAVLLIFYAGRANSVSSFNDPLKTKLVLTKRQANLSKHASQISFPGGRRDTGETLEQTAVREAFEEVGIPGNQIDVLGQLNPVYIPPTDFTVTPFIGWHAGHPSFVRSEAEVEEIIETSLMHLLNPATLIFGEVEVPDRGPQKVPYYQVGSHRVWGATAIMVGELIDRISRVR